MNQTIIELFHLMVEVGLLIVSAVALGMNIKK